MLQYKSNTIIRHIKMKIKEYFHPILLFGVHLFLKYKVSIVNDENTVLKTNVIFAVNHSNAFDFPVSARTVQQHFIILADSNLQKDILVNMLNRLNGCIYVDRKNCKSRAYSKRKIIECLSDGKNILMFPEGTWNLHPCKLMLPLNWGIIDISKTANVPIVPIVIEYNEDTVAYVKIGKAYIPTRDKLTEIQCLTDKMATMKWDLICKKPHVSRKELSDDYFEKYIQSCLKEYRRFDLEYETSVIRKEYDTTEEVFSHLNKLIPDGKNAFLYNKRNHF